jgi:hypothetical protein
MVFDCRWRNPYGKLQEEENQSLAKANENLRLRVIQIKHKSSYCMYDKEEEEMDYIMICTGSFFSVTMCLVGISILHNTNFPPSWKYIRCSIYQTTTVQ